MTASSRPDEATVRDVLRSAIDRVLVDCDETQDGVTSDAVRDARAALEAFWRREAGIEVPPDLQRAAAVLAGSLRIIEMDELTDGDLEDLRGARAAIAGPRASPGATGLPREEVWEVTLRREDLARLDTLTAACERANPDLFGALGHRPDVIADAIAIGLRELVRLTGHGAWPRALGSSR